MQVSQPMLQLLLYKKAQNEQAKEQNTNVETINEPTIVSNIVCTNITPTSEDYKTADAFAIENNGRKLGANEICDNEKILSANSVTVSTLDPNLISQIKRTIYDLHHRTSTPNNNGGNTGGTTTPTNPAPADPDPTNPGSGNDNGGDELTPEAGILTGITTNFTSVDEMFTYISVNKTDGLSANKLWQLTQRDDWEQNNNYFFGRLNEAFNEIDKNEDNILSYDEICTFVGDEMNLTEYSTAVNNYSNYLQSLFKNMSAEEKLQFAIDKAREYFEAVGLTEQLEALERLKNEDKLGFVDLNPGKTYESGTGWTLGAYAYLTVDNAWYTDDLWDWNNDGIITKEENVAKGYHAGIYLDKYYYTERANTKWYDLVATMVHELTHATASYNPTDKTQWGEYVAYQTDEDYKDSIAHGKYSGTAESSGITNHINENYENEPVPVFDWTTYGTYA